MSNPYASSIPLLPTGHAPQAGPLELPNFLSEVSAFTTQLHTFQSSIEGVAQLHNAALVTTADSDTSYSAGASSRLEAAVAECSAQARSLKDFVKSLERDMLLTERDGDLSQARTKRGQVETARSNLQSALREFEKTERTYRTRYNELLARQYRIVHPEATEQEIAHAVESGQTQVFSQALLNSNRSASANSVAKAVRERQQDIARIERTLEELMVLFEQMEEQVLLADPVVDNIQHQSENVTTDIEGARQHLGTAVVSAQGARRKKWWCLLIVVLIIIVIVVIVVVVVVVNGGGSRGGGNNNNANTNAARSGGTSPGRLRRRDYLLIA